MPGLLIIWQVVESQLPSSEDSGVKGYLSHLCHCLIRPQRAGARKVWNSHILTVGLGSVHTAGECSREGEPRVLNRLCVCWVWVGCSSDV